MSRAKSSNLHGFLVVFIDENPQLVGDIPALSLQGLVNGLDWTLLTSQVCQQLEPPDHILAIPNAMERALWRDLRLVGVSAVLTKSQWDAFSCRRMPHTLSRIVSSSSSAHVRTTPTTYSPPSRNDDSAANASQSHSYLSLLGHGKPRCTPAEHESSGSPDRYVQHLLAEH